MEVKINSPNTVQINIGRQNAPTVDVNSDGISPGGEYVPAYTGAYEVTPSPDAEILETNGKRMTDDVTVHGVPYTDMAGVSGGRIVSIG